MKRLVLILTIILTCVTSSFATHLISAEITYTHVTGNDYEVTLAIYGDCSGIAFPASQNTTFMSTSCGQNFNSSLPLIQTIDVSQVCAGQTTTCNGGTVPGIKQYTYRGIVTMTPCTDWIISWNSCCRSPSITNLLNPNTQSMYIQNTLNNAIGTNNSSAQYANLPVPYLSINNLTTFNHGATDIDGDSLYYSLVTPLTTPGPPGSPISYAAGHSASQPILTTSGFNFNPTNGEMCFTPSQNQVAVISTLIEEFRNGILIGSQIRELQAYVLNSTNQSPNTGIIPTCGNTATSNITSSGPSVTQIDGNSISMCPGDNFCFQLNPVDPDGNNITVSSNVSTALQGATFTVTNNNTANPTATICWNSSITEHGLKNFSITLTDDACPITGSQNYSYDVLLLTGVYAGMDQTICGTQTAQLNATGGATYTWFDANTNIQVPVGPEFSCNPCANPVASPNVTRNYYVSSPGIPCGSTDTVKVSVALNFTADVIGDTILCPLISAQLDVNITSGPVGTYSYSWNNTTTLNNANIQNPIANPTVSTWYTPTITSPQGCTKILDSAYIEILQTPITYENQAICQGDSIILGGSYQNTAGTYYDTLQAINGCDSVIATTLSISNFSASYSYINNGNGNYSFSNSSTGGYLFSDWNFGDGTTSSSTNPSHTFTTNGTYTVVLAIADSSILNGGSCIQYFIDTIIVSNAPSPLQCNAGFVLYPDPSSTNILIINNSTGSNLTYLWDFGDGNTSTLQNPTHTYSGAGPYHLCVTVDDGNGCVNIFCDSVTVNGVAFKGAGFTINVISTPINTGINNSNSLIDITIQPNPTNGIFTINNLTNIAGDVQLKIFDISSRLILNKIISTNKDKIEVDIASYNKGIYFMQLTTEKGTITKRIIKK